MKVVTLILLSLGVSGFGLAYADSPMACGGCINKDITTTAPATQPTAAMNDCTKTELTAGCCDKEKTPPTTAPATQPKATASLTTDPSITLLADTPASQPATSDFGNTKCPIMNEDVDPKFDVVYNGVTYHLCCKSCIKKFNKTPDKYVKAMTENPEKYGLKK